MQSKVSERALFRTFYFIAAWLSLVLGIVGIFVPLLPTTPFVLLSAYCFSRSSEKLHQKLLAHPRFGPMVHNWEEHRVIPRRAKWLSSTMMTVMVGYPVLVRSWPLWIKGLAVLMVVCVAWFVWSCPSEPDKSA